MKVSIGFHCISYEGDRMVCVEATLEEAIARTIQLASDWIDVLEVYEVEVGSTITSDTEPTWIKRCEREPEESAFELVELPPSDEPITIPSFDYIIVGGNVYRPSEDPTDE